MCAISLGSGVVTRRPLILQLVNIPPKTKTKKHARDKKEGEAAEDNEQCKLLAIISFRCTCSWSFAVFPPFNTLQDNI